ncbi:MAG: peptidoglycan-associated lipoprotein Pal [Alphaproteobacteria bacterium]|nr:peptidoglycan-associated lipoprotein Pal [Alphaproteobacteria bacterium]MDA8006166.1 peptidoglycan-associated lipoprotein Pal [Alphaproteobacteria bacterium]MDA8008749.1 peptidoglycan-associated lipoprotein Pal [Alphaproteobacteria bacterium]MDA8030590.1 peptidoglycan-associated lipoprotein Pal [Alphaproteobacteria bacterium]
MAPSGGKASDTCRLRGDLPGSATAAGDRNQGDEDHTMSSWKILTVAVLAVFLTAGCAQRADEAATSASSSASSSGGSSSGASAAPAQVEAGSQEDLVVSVGDRVFFDFDSSAIRADQELALDRLIAWLDTNSSARLLLEGHADERGTTEYNLSLGERRANSVREYLIAGGVAGARLQTVSYGEERAAVLGSNENSWAQNRRSQFRVR